MKTNGRGPKMKKHREKDGALKNENETDDLYCVILLHWSLKTRINISNPLTN